mmetsp:Transcript_1033/g.1324  ORF Transcript_1033/g.1324 Transcript_1033/m.1324 type:complete len:142 (-) Transcript_1033:1-426(-)
MYRKAGSRTFLLSKIFARFCSKLFFVSANAGAAFDDAIDEPMKNPEAKILRKLFLCIFSGSRAGYCLDCAKCDIILFAGCLHCLKLSIFIPFVTKGNMKPEKRTIIPKKKKLQFNGHFVEDDMINKQHNHIHHIHVGEIDC